MLIVEDLRTIDTKHENILEDLFDKDIIDFGPLFCTATNNYYQQKFSHSHHHI